MESEEKKIVINNTHYDNLDQVPEPLRSEVQARIDAARAAGPGKPGTGPSKIVFHKEFKFQGKPDMAGGLIKLLLKLAPPPVPRAPKPTGFAPQAPE